MKIEREEKKKSRYFSDLQSQNAGLVKFRSGQQGVFTNCVVIRNSWLYPTVVEQHTLFPSHHLSLVLQVCAVWTPRGRRFCTTWSLSSTRPCSRGCREARTTTPSQVLYSPNSIVPSAVQRERPSHNRPFFLVTHPAGVAVALKQAMTSEFKAYQMQVLANCRALSAALIDHGYKIVTGKGGPPVSGGSRRP